MFKCKHPFKYLAVLGDSTETPVDEDFKTITHRPYCLKCGQEDLEISYSKMIGGVKGFMSRAGQQEKKS